MSFDDSTCHQDGSLLDESLPLQGQQVGVVRILCMIDEDQVKGLRTGSISQRVVDHLFVRSMLTIQHVSLSLTLFLSHSVSLSLSLTHSLASFCPTSVDNPGTKVTLSATPAHSTIGLATRSVMATPGSTE